MVVVLEEEISWTEVFGEHNIHRGDWLRSAGTQHIINYRDKLGVQGGVFNYIFVFLCYALRSSSRLAKLKRKVMDGFVLILLLALTLIVGVVIGVLGTWTWHPDPKPWKRVVKKFIRFPRGRRVTQYGEKYHVSKECEGLIGNKGLLSRTSCLLCCSEKV